MVQMRTPALTGVPKMDGRKGINDPSLCLSADFDIRVGSFKVDLDFALNRKNVVIVHNQN